MKKIAYVAIIAVIVVICGYAIEVASERDKMIAEDWIVPGLMKQYELYPRIPVCQNVTWF